MISISRVQLFLSLSVLATAFNPTPDTPPNVEIAQRSTTSESNGLQFTRGAGSVFGGPHSLGHGPVVASDITFTINTANSLETNVNIKRDDSEVTKSIYDSVTETAASEESEATDSGESEEGAEAENSQATEAGNDTAVTDAEENGSAPTGFGGEYSGSFEPTGTFESGEGFTPEESGFPSGGPFGGFSGFPTDFSFTGFPSDFTFQTDFPSGSGHDHHHFPHQTGSFTGFPSDFSGFPKFTGFPSDFSGFPQFTGFPSDFSGAPQFTNIPSNVPSGSFSDEPIQNGGDYTLESGDANSDFSADDATYTAVQASPSVTSNAESEEDEGNNMDSQTDDDSTDGTVTSSATDSDYSEVGRKFGRHSRHSRQNQQTTVAKAYEITTVIESTSAAQDADDLVKRAATESEGAGNTVNAVIGLVAASWLLALL
ncbi:unnamed protein product [Ambrosiozyma monospora]|uniref:Unnamed protein product n=1 Tax=Ambrosiozyma monospora TaxID=43982 RepID=A0A9W6Z3C5_AMBMO|nr:unnamed protein product [Ambrosiozyma monospora]